MTTSISTYARFVAIAAATLQVSEDAINSLSGGEATIRQFSGNAMEVIAPIAWHTWAPAWPTPGAAIHLDFVDPCTRQIHRIQSHELVVAHLRLTPVVNPTIHGLHEASLTLTLAADPPHLQALVRAARAAAGQEHLATLTNLVHGNPFLSPATSALVMGLLDAARAQGVPSAAPAGERSAPFWDLRAMVAKAQLPEGDDDSLYLFLSPFNLKIQRTDEGLVLDVFSALDPDNPEPLATTYAFASEAQPDTDATQGPAA